MPSIFPIGPYDTETFDVVTNPVRTYESSSVYGPTGSVYLFSRHSSIIKDAQPDSSFVESTHNDIDLSSALREVQMAAQSARQGIVQQGFAPAMQHYLDTVNSAGQARRLQETMDVVRYVPGVDIGPAMIRKQVVKDTLNSYYHVSYPTAHWAYTNYNTLNFFTSSTVPTSSVLLYPNIDTGTEFHQGYVSGTYTPSGSISFDFYINPRYRPDLRDGSFKAGTIFHLSSCYALSLVSGSLKDEHGKPAGFRLLLQLGRSADVAPSLASRGKYPSDLVFLSDDNALLWNNWHHVVVRWGTNLTNNGTGSFNIDSIDRGTFCVPSSTIAPLLPAGNGLPPDVLCVGNYYEGMNAGSSSLASFFAYDPATRDGLEIMLAETGVETPPAYAFRHPLNAELHDLAIKRVYMSNADITASAGRSPLSFDSSYMFYVPPFFTAESPFRQSVGDHGGILVTPFEEINGITSAPFSVALSFGAGGHYINLENFCMDFANGLFPLLHHMTASAIQTSTDAETCNQFLYSQPFVARRNLSILPCDDGSFVPRFQLLAPYASDRTVDDLGTEELSFVNLDNMFVDGALMFGPGAFDDGTVPVDKVNSFADSQIGTTPENPFAQAGPALQAYIQKVREASTELALQAGAGVSANADYEYGAPLTVYQRTRDPSSNEVVLFNISNMFYGLRIKPGTFVLSDDNLSGSGGAISITLKDDGRGNIYRADCLTSQTTWNSVGNIYYDEGIVVIKSPHLYFFGQDWFRMSFRGEQHIHVMTINALAPSNMLNSSSNPSYEPLPPSDLPNDSDDRFVYISNLNFHDKHLNVVMKTSLAQPIIKRTGDAIMMRIKFDF